MKTKDDFLRGAKVTQDNQIFGSQSGGGEMEVPPSRPPAQKTSNQKATVKNKTV
ncbi:hypothetical protein [Bacillus sp. T33-2]|uniref:hypothetical protein n=1 Tax=Bacillus sp. T33-2 TaxID=2054168 RepID=UPI0015E0A4BD|nr:hypothetical protein [Bacillus sp. T33-2]